MARLVPDFSRPTRLEAARIRVIYADTDCMGVVYHATYLRYLEQARVEFIRSLGYSYADMEREGFGLPVTDMAVSYLAPAVYDDVITVRVGLSKVSFARVNFFYRVFVKPGDRVGLESELDLIRAESRHGCMSLQDKSASRLPDKIHTLLSEAYEQSAPASEG